MHTGLKFKKCHLTHKACHCQIKMTCQISQFRTLPAMVMYMRPYLVSIAVGHCHEWHCQQWLLLFNNAASLSLPNSCCVVTMVCYSRGNNHCPIVAMSVPWPLLDSCHDSTMDISKFALKNESRFLWHCWQLCGNVWPLWDLNSCYHSQPGIIPELLLTELTWVLESWGKYAS